MTSSESQGSPEQTTASTRDERIQSPHDRLINQTLQQAEAARDLLPRHLPGEIVQHLKLGTLLPVDTSFIDRSLRRRFADRLFSVAVSDEIVRSLKMRSSHINVLVLIGHKSTDEPYVLVQMLGYIVRIWALSSNPSAAG